LESPDRLRRYFLQAERAGWRVTDLDWENADTELVSPTVRAKVIEASIVEHGVPHYLSLWTKLQEADWYLKQVAIQWAGEETRHDQALRMLVEHAGWEAEASFIQVENTDFYQRQRALCASRCFDHPIGNLTYTTLQEFITWAFYHRLSQNCESRFVSDVLSRIGRDEIRHHHLFATTLAEYYKPGDRGVIIEAIRHFAMPHHIYPMLFPNFEKEEEREESKLKAKARTWGEPLLKVFASIDPELPSIIQREGLFEEMLLRNRDLMETKVAPLSYR
jgi:rubrerythrin